MTEKLLNYQLTHVENLVYSLTTYSRALDASDTGTGKTYSSVAVCKTFGWKPFIVCPKSVIEPWISVLKLMNCDYYGISNYEMLQNCNYITPQGVKTKATFLKKKPSEKEKSTFPMDTDESDTIENTYEWISGNT